MKNLVFPLMMAACLTGIACAQARPEPDPATCDMLLKHADTGMGSHTEGEDCTNPQCGNGVNPPTGGLHCIRLASCRQFDEPLNRCNWIHNLEHGHAVFAYNCPSGCPDVVAAFKKIADAQPRGSNGVPRVLITPDPLLPTRVAAVVWGWSYTGEDVNEDAINCLLARQDKATYEYTECAP
jgi:hypothetical protein